MASHKFRRTTLLLLGFIAFLAGVGLAHTGRLIDGSWWWVALGLGLFTFRKKNVWALFWIILLGLSLGWWRGSIYMQRLGQWQQFYNHRVTISAVAMDDGVYAKNTQMSFDGNQVMIDGQMLTGKMSLSGFGLNAVFQGDEVQASGKLYSTLGAAQGRMSFAQLQIVRHHPSLIPDLRRKFAAGMQNALPEPLASFAMGLLIGQRATLPADVKQDLLMVGLTHIIAVSGYNLTIMLRASRGVFGKKSKRISTLLSLMLIGVFLLFAGNSASIVRAAIVSLLSIGAGYYGRQVKPLLLIAMAAAITAYASPFYVWTDTSWYLSFLAFYGVMVLAPMVAVRLRIKWQNSLVAMVALESLCAELMTLPFVLHTFGQMSFIGLVANVMVVALVPLAMLLSMIAGLAGMLAAPVAGWFAWPARLLLTYMLDIAHMLSRIPHIFVQNLSLPASEMIALYALLSGLTYLLWNKTKQLKSDTITDKIY
ncbi:MAG TPA: ComEC/Rec2 family competence protein [Patescibacteria group bacterium]|nr:ComEC/Rec2 family competence protein [Patescibacteria group bacterium]